jgi:hypothetical protein
MQKNAFMLNNITKLNFPYTATQEADSHSSEVVGLYLISGPYMAIFQWPS